jgi:hypothetical protein
MLLGLLVGLLLSWAWASPVAELRNPGRVDPNAPAALVVTTPGVAPGAYMNWVEALEGAGFDAQLLVFGVGSLQDTVDGIRHTTAALEERGYVLAAHGYGGVLALLAHPNPRRLALAATPLGPQVADIRWPAQVPSVGLPWPQDWIGSLEGAPLAPELARTYRAWAGVFPEIPVPQVPTWLASSGRDPVAPPETVRIPSVDWPNRTWKRVGPLSLDSRELTHGEMLTDENLARDLAKFLGESP